MNSVWILTEPQTILYIYTLHEIEQRIHSLMPQFSHPWHDAESYCLEESLQGFKEAINPSVSHSAWRKNQWSTVMSSLSTVIFWWSCVILDMSAQVSIYTCKFTAVWLLLLSAVVFFIFSEDNDFFFLWWGAIVILICGYTYKIENIVQNYIDLTKLQ